MIHYISAERLTIARVEEILTKGYKLALSEDAVKRITHCREYLDQKTKTVGRPIYGVTTGFGSLCNISVEEEGLSQLQKIGNILDWRGSSTFREFPLLFLRRYRL